MEYDFFLHKISEMLYITLIVSSPALVLAAVLGFTIALIQAVTQIQDQSLPQTIKLIVVGVFILSLGGAFIAPLVEYSRDVFLYFYKYV